MHDVVPSIHKARNIRKREDLIQFHDNWYFNGEFNM